MSPTFALSGGRERRGILNKIHRVDNDEVVKTGDVDKNWDAIKVDRHNFSSA